MKKQTKQWLIIYGIFLCLVFVAGPMLGVVETKVVYNMTCSNGTIEWFNESSIEVCGKENPLIQSEEYYIDENYISVEEYLK